MKKRIFALASAVVIIAIMVITQQNAKAALTGTATADGFGGKDAITVSITVKDGKIANVTAQGPNETPGVGSKAIDAMPGEMVAKNSINVDWVSGATISSTGIAQAAEKALTAAGLNPADFGGGKAQASSPAPAPAPAAPAPAPAPKAEKADDGSVTGTAAADGFGGPGALTVSITLKDGKIVDAKAEGPKETDGIGSVAVARMPGDMVAANSIKVDGVSGATVTSTGILKAAEEALKAAGVNPEDYKKAVEIKAEDKEYTADVAVIGAGGAGMIAAIVAADAGKKVVLIEKQAMVGGNSVRASGGMNAADTPEQDKNKFTEEAGVEKTLKTAAEKWADNPVVSALAQAVKAKWDAYKAKPEGYFDCVELMQLDTIIGGHGINNPELVEALVKGTADAIAWLKTIDIDLKSVGAAGGASVKRIHRPLNEQGKVVSVGGYMIPRLEKAVKARSNITLLTETTATSIMTKDGKVSGVEATNRGAKVTVNAKAVVIAAGGFGANLKMVARLNPALAGFMTTNAPGINGDGITMAQELGAATVDMKQIQIHPTVQYDSSNLITEGLRGDGAILVNINGKRFIDEVLTRDVVSKAEIEQPESYAWLVIDQKMVDDSLLIQGYISKGYTFKGETYEELAKTLGIPADVFAKTMNDWNGYVKARKDPDFGRTSFIEPLDKAPFYAIKVTPGIHHTMGGIRIDGRARVLKADGTVIPGLFAAGEVTGGVHGGNRLGGTAVSDFVVYGRIAGQEAANF
ncbi:MAG: flavocytochrome c [Synergistaceae bacterium]|nr:flavocytochrome c [Synergistaceae bacterium]